MMREIKTIPNFVECNNLEDANNVDLSEYRLIDVNKGVYYFARRARRQGL